eukprot:2006056-Pleurochrysis_carterae.AAC.2
MQLAVATLEAFEARQILLALAKMGSLTRRVLLSLTWVYCWSLSPTDEVTVLPSAPCLPPSLCTCNAALPRIASPLAPSASTDP